MKKNVLCETCREFVEYNIIKKEFHDTIKGIEVTYSGEEAVCKSCGEIVYVADINDRNLEYMQIAYNKVKEQKKNELIIIIDEICDKYNIGKKPLAKVLGWSEATIMRYYNGEQLPLPEYHSTLVEIKNDPFVFREKLEKNKTNIAPITYEKSKIALSELSINNTNKHKKIEDVTKYLLLKCEDVTPLALQKLLYYTQSFNKVFNNKFMFEDDCEAWIHGPVYRETYEQFKRYGYNIIDDILIKEEDLSSLSVTEKELIDNITIHLGCYSGKILENMTHVEMPWLTTRGDLKENENCDKVISKELINDYFLSIKEKYKMINPSDIRDYSKDLFEKITH